MLAHGKHFLGDLEGLRSFLGLAALAFTALAAGGAGENRRES
jgi:hypothetical protein